MKKILAGVLAGVVFGVLGGGLPWDRAHITVKADRENPFSYGRGEEMSFTVGVEELDFAKCPAGTKLEWFVASDDGTGVTNRVDIGELKNPLVVKAKLGKPGFVWVGGRIVRADGYWLLKSREAGGHKILFNAGAGVEPEKLAFAEEPEDFDRYWEGERRKLAAVPARAERREVESGNPNARMYAVRVDCAGARPVTGYLSVPKACEESGLKVPVRLSFQGYGEVVQKPHRWTEGGRAVMQVNAFGYELGREEEYYRGFFEGIRSNGVKYAFDPEQNSRRETAYFHDMALRAMRALEYLKSLPCWDGKGISIQSGSQGGLQAIWAAAYSREPVRLELAFPWCAGLSMQEWSGLRDGYQPDYRRALDYYDPIFFVKRLSADSEFHLTHAGLGDYTCPPAGMRRMWLNVPCRVKTARWVQGSSHMHTARGAQVWREAGGTR